MSEMSSQDSQELAGLFPNLPDPVNGMIKTYDNQGRTFSRPYSAKTIFFYKEGDEHFTVSQLSFTQPLSKSSKSILFHWYVGSWIIWKKTQTRETQFAVPWTYSREGTSSVLSGDFFL